MKECKSCFYHILDIFGSISNGNVDNAILSTEKLLAVLKTYKESC